jgi:hypothetical protein
MNEKMVLAGLGLVMIVLSLTALSAGTTRAIDAQCTRRCDCAARPCGAIVSCQDGFGLWTRCCTWCST